MSNNVDNRVVQMDFDNAKFERGVRTTLESLTKLKSELEMEKSTKSLSRLSKATDVSLDSISRSLNSLNRKFSTFGIAWSTTVKNITDNTVNKFRDAINQIKTGGFSRSQNIEQANFMLGGLLTKAEKKAGKLKEITDAAMDSVTDTAYGYDSAAKAAAQFYATGIKDGDQMKNILLGVAGTAAMTGREYDDIAHIFTTVAGNGRLMGDQLNQLAASGINAAATLGQQLGKTEAEIREMTSKGEIDFKTFANAMSDAFGKHAKEANNTFNGALSNMKAALSRMGADFYTPYMENMRKIFVAITPVINALKKVLTPVYKLYNAFFEAIQKFAVKELGKAEKVINRLGKRLSYASLAFEELGGIKNLIRIFKDLGKVVKSVAKPIGQAFMDVFDFGGRISKFWRPMKKAEEATKKYQDLIKKGSELGKSINKEGERGVKRRGLILGNNLTEMVKKFRNFTKSITISDEVLQNLRDTFAGLFSIIDIVARAIGAIVKALFPTTKVGASAIEVILSITGAIGRVITKLDQFIQRSGAINKVTTVLQTIFYGLSKAISFVLSGVSKLAPIISDLALKSMTFLTEKVGALSRRIKLKDFGKIGEKIKKVGGYIKDFFDDLTDFGDHDFSGFSLTSIKDALDDLKPHLETIVDKIKKFIDSLDIKGRFGKVSNNFINKLREIKEQGLINFIKSINIKDKAFEVGNKIKDFFLNLKNLDWSSVGKTIGDGVAVIAGLFIKLKDFIVDFYNNNISGKLSTIGQTLKELFTNIKDSISGKSLDALTVANGVLEGIGKTIRDTGGGISEGLKAISDAFKKVNWKLVESVVAGVIAAVFAFKEFKALSSVIESSKKTSKAIRGVLEGTKEFLENFGTFKILHGKVETPFDQLLKIASSLLILSAALKLISMVPVKKMIPSLGVLAGLLGGLIVFTFILSKALEKVDSENLQKLSKSLVLISLAVGLLSGSLLLLNTAFEGNNDWYKSLVGLGAIVAAISIMVGVIGLMVNSFSKGDKAEASIKNFAEMGVAILVMSRGVKQVAKAVTILSQIDGNAMWRGIAAVSVIMALFMAFAAVSSLGKYAIGAALAMVLLGVAVAEFAGLVLAMSNIDINESWTGFAVVGGIMLMFALFIVAASEAQDALKAAVLVVSVIAFLQMVIDTIWQFVDIFSDLDGPMVAALATVGAIMAFLIIIAVIASKTKGVSGKTGGGIAAIGIGLLAIAIAIERLTQVSASLPQIAAGFVVLAVAFGLLIGAMLVLGKMKGGEKGAFGFLAMALGLSILASVIAMIVALPISALAISLAALAISIALLGGVMAILGKVAGVPMLLVGAAFALLAGAVYLLSLALKGLIDALYHIIPLIGTFAAFPKNLLSSGLAAIVTVLETLGGGIAKLGAGILLFGIGLAAAGAGALILSGGLMAASAAGIIFAGAIIVVGYALARFAQTVQVSVGTIGEVITNVFGFVFGGIKSIVEGIVGTFGSLFEKIGNLKDDISEKLQGTSEEGKEVPKEFAKGIEEGSGEAQKAIDNSFDPSTLFSSFKEGAKTEAGDMGEGFSLNFSDSVKSFLPEQFSGFSMESMLNPEEMAGSLGIDVADSFGGDFSSALTSMADGGDFDLSALGDTISDSAKNPEGMKDAASVDIDAFFKEATDSKKPTEAGDKISSKSAEGAKDKKGHQEAGRYNVDGYVSGMTSPDALQRAYNAGKRLGEKAKQGEKDATETSSPSKVFIKLGMYLSQGFAIGIERFSELAYDAAYDMGKGSTDVVKHMLSNISDVVDTDFEYNPTITPVVDMSNVTASSNTLNRMFGSHTFGLSVPNGVELAGTIAADLNNQNGAQYAIADQVSDLARKLDNVTNAMNSRQLIQNNYIDGATDPTAFADQLTRKMKLNVRTM